jgi:hypothetical protein
MKTLKIGGTDGDNNTWMKRRQTTQHLNLQSLPSNKDIPVSIIPDLYTMHQYNTAWPVGLKTDVEVFAAELRFLFMAGYYTTLIQSRNERIMIHLYFALQT